MCPREGKADDTTRTALHLQPELALCCSGDSVRDVAVLSHREISLRIGFPQNTGCLDTGHGRHAQFTYKFNGSSN